MGFATYPLRRSRVASGFRVSGLDFECHFRIEHLVSNRVSGFESGIDPECLVSTSSLELEAGVSADNGNAAGHLEAFPVQPGSLARSLVLPVGPVRLADYTHPPGKVQFQTAFY